MIYDAAHCSSAELLVDRTDKHTRLEIDLIEITNSVSTLILCYTQVSRLSNSRLSIFPITFVFFVTMLALNCSRIHLSHSFFLLSWNISDTQITPHHSYTLTLATLILPNKHHVFSLIYGNHYHRSINPRGSSQISRMLSLKLLLNNRREEIVVRSLYRFENLYFYLKVL